MNVLCLHRMGHPDKWRESVRLLEFMFKESNENINCIVHDADIKFPNQYKNIDFHLVILGPTFLCSRYNPNDLKRIRLEYDFIGKSTSFKVALPQDDYDCSEVLENWMIDWNTDLIYTVIANNWQVLYPRYFEKNKIRLGYTGYISLEWINKWKQVKARDERTIDVSYRAAKLPYNFGSIGLLKSEIADTFVKSLPENHNLNIDISINPRDTLPGVKWLNFLENSKFCLTSPSGSSIHDPKGEIRTLVKTIESKDSGKSFQEIKELYLKEIDLKYVFTAISPRNIEAGLAKTVQIGVKDEYSGMMLPMIHYIPLEKDCSNIRNVIEIIKNNELVSNMANNWKDAILRNKRLLSEEIVSEIIQATRNHYYQLKKEIISKKEDIFLIAKYEKNIQLNTQITYCKYRFQNAKYNIKKILSKKI